MHILVERLLVLLLILPEIFSDLRLAQTRSKPQKPSDICGRCGVRDELRLLKSDGSQATVGEIGEIVYDGPADQVDQGVLDAIYQGKQEEPA